ncbi:diguanylate cyclase/phosphodiesterase with PAS/PAC sensor(s) [Mycolicibacterium rhodesiae JS60]|nr:diguanylate cyclase/phosphodiesterase with PAS/PAC sensor(s) [Mycolicibacterium rhodesiae JS60]
MAQAAQAGGEALQAASAPTVRSDLVADPFARTTLSVLIVGAEPGDGARAEAALSGAYDVQAVQVVNEDGLRRALGERSWDIVLASHNPSAIDARATLDIVVRCELGIPVVVISTVPGEEVAVEMLQRGADDYLLVTSLHRLSAAAGRAITQADERRERRVRDHVISLIWEHSRDLIVIADTDGRFLTVSAASSEMLGYEPEELVGERLDKVVIPEDVAVMEETFAAIVEGEQISKVECRYAHTSGEVRHLVWSVAYAPADGAVIGIARDVTERRRIEANLRQERDYADAVLNSLPGAFYHFNEDQRLVRWNRNLERITGYSPSELLNMEAAKFIPQDDREPVAKQIREVYSRGESQVEAYYLVKDGRRIPYLFTGVRFDHDGQRGFVGVGTDLTERRRMEDALREETALFEGVVTHAPDGIIVTDINGHRIFQNRRLSELLALTPEVENDTDPLRQLASVARIMVDPGEFLDKARWLLEHPTEHAHDEVELLNGTVLDRLSGPIVDNDGRCYGRIWSYRDVSDRHQVERLLRHLATHDDLTGLANRALIEDRVEELAVDPRRSGRPFAVLFIDLDRFKFINDGYGHAFGDALLKAVGELLVTVVREGDVVARHGGDEFLILLAEIAGPEEATVVAQSIADHLATPFMVRGREVYLSGSIGVSLFPDHGRTAGTLISNADVAMFHSKEEGRNTVRLYTQQMGERSLQRVQLETALRAALPEGQLRLVYQPKVSLADGRIVGCEALLRWLHPDLGLVGPSRFIPIAEESGLIVPLADWVLREVCRQAGEWLDAGLPPLSIAVNVSAQQIHDQDVVAWVVDTLHETGFPPDLLELELTESLITRNSEAVVATVDGLRAAGVRVAIDDFGTGYSTLADLRRFHVDALKIDRSFVRGMLAESNDATIVRAVITLAHNLGITVVAEGVETEEQGTFLRQAGCDEAQGYVFGKPVSAKNLEDLLRKNQLR